MTEYSLDPVHLTVIYLFLVQLKRTVGGGMHSNELICVHTVYNTVSVTAVTTCLQTVCV